MTKKFIGWGIIAGLALAVLGVTLDASDDYFTLVVVLMFVSGIWGAIILIKSN